MRRCRSNATAAITAAAPDALHAVSRAAYDNQLGQREHEVQAKLHHLEAP
jgi:multisubunit Na+/H+ antiporter MnhG subunit